VSLVKSKQTFGITFPNGCLTLHKAQLIERSVRSHRRDRPRRTIRRPCSDHCWF